MTEIVFYHHVADPLRFALRLVVQLYTQQRTVRVLTQDAAMTAEFDRLLWTQNPIGFYPHCGVGNRLAGETPVLVDDILDHQHKADVLINLQRSPPPFFSRFEKLAEIIGDEQDNASAGRERWRFYQARGYPMQVHDMSGGG